MPYSIIYPDTGSDPRLMRESLSELGVRISAIGSLVGTGTGQNCVPAESAPSRGDRLTNERTKPNDSSPRG